MATRPRAPSAPKKSKRPIYLGCNTLSSYGHVAIPWSCRVCGTKKCATCAHRFTSNRSSFTLTDAGARLFTCYACSPKPKGGV
jgi:hypothetical protein